MPNPHPYRCTQRAPLACTACAARKIKCSRDIPCRQCISRGVAADCKREVVVVRGRVRTADVPVASATNAELQLENARLAALVATGDAQDELDIPAFDLTEHYEKRLHAAVGGAQEDRTVSSVEDIIMPSERCSHAFMDIAETWTSWVHFALFFPHFRQEHTQFWCDGGSLTSQQPLWLAVYFSVLASTLVLGSQEELEQSRLPLTSRPALLRNWYDAAIYFLEVGDFMQKSDITVARAVAILGIVFTNVGDTKRHTNLWACAIRIAQDQDFGSDRAHISETPLERECRRRLWWTLVLCEWLPIPARTPCINDVDFDCQLPLDVDDSRLELTTDSRLLGGRQEPRPVQYHIVMAKIATIIYQLRAKMRLRRWSAAEIAVFVFQADDQLAALVEQLPAHLQNDEVVTPATQARDGLLPWIAFQKTRLAMAILYYRLSINRVLQTHWLEGSTNYARARIVCLSSAVGVIRSAVARSADRMRLRSW